MSKAIYEEMLQMVTMIWELMQYIWMKLRKSYLLFKVNGGQTEQVLLLKTKCPILLKEFRECWKKIWQEQILK